MQKNQNINPYEAPGAELSDYDDNERDSVFELNIFSANGRIGRVRYLAYGVGFGSLFYVVLMVAAVLGHAIGNIVYILMALVALACYVGIIYLNVMLTIKRCHDFNSSGWLTLLALVPLVNLLFVFIPGSPGENRYGRRTPPNTTLNIMGACVIPIIAIIGILAAIALPAYQDYTRRAHAVQGYEQPSR